MKYEIINNEKVVTANGQRIVNPVPALIVFNQNPSARLRTSTNTVVSKCRKEAQAYKEMRVLAVGLINNQNQNINHLLGIFILN